MTENKLVVSTSPHIRDTANTRKIMLQVIIALAPATIYALVIFGLPAFWVLLASISGALLGEFAMQKGRRLPVTLSDGSAFLTGLLLALTLPPELPWWIALVGGLTATILGKQIFGGLGHNIFNPALVGRAVVFVSWASYMTTSYFKSAAIGIANTSAHQHIVDLVSGATPLAAMKAVYDPAGATFVPQGLNASNYYKPLLLANPWGCIGEVSALLLILGGLYLIATRIIDWRIPLTYVGTVAVLTAFTGRDPLFYTLSGGLLIGAIYMATDYTTSPLSSRGKVIFGLGLGLMTFLLRFWSNNPEGVMFSILFMNGMVPLIDRYILPRKYGKLRCAEEGG
ncbi:MAG: RnfABCDGE type electron transport complex subunit D [Actinomycetota bacterium]|nr:RnfABCDGE type electron transport complex subunit D [Actinomycetota bacterium]